jgi:response regulator RpfG family c-di-GMP phosphodiesterase
VISPRLAPVLLLVDDEERILSALCRSLRREGYELLTARSAAEALRVLDERPVDVILSDQKMPGTNGLDLFGEVSRRHPEVVRMLLTGWPEEVPAAEVRSLGIAAVIPKPWDDAALKATVRSHARAA